MVASSRSRYSSPNRTTPASTRTVCSANAGTGSVEYSIRANGPPGVWDVSSNGTGMTDGTARRPAEASGRHEGGGLWLGLRVRALPVDASELTPEWLSGVLGAQVVDVK